MATLKLFQWRDDLVTNVAVIDAQHRQYFDRVNQALHHVGAAVSREDFTGSLDFVRQYAVFHFDTEQDAMQFHAYPGYGAHLEQHQFFAQRLDELCADFQTQGFDPGLAARLHNLLVGWFVNHIRLEDQKLARFLNARGT